MAVDYGMKLLGNVLAFALPPHPPPKKTLATEQEISIGFLKLHRNANIGYTAWKTNSVDLYPVMLHQCNAGYAMLPPNRTQTNLSI